MPWGRGPTVDYDFLAYSHAHVINVRGGHHYSHLVNRKDTTTTQKVFNNKYMEKIKTTCILNLEIQLQEGPTLPK